MWAEVTTRPVWTQPEGVYVHRNVGCEHAPSAKCLCAPRFYTWEEVNRPGFRDRLNAKLAAELN